MSRQGLAAVTLFPASLLFGTLWEKVSVFVAFAFGAGCALLAAGLLAFWVRDHAS